jgi:translation initiation factor IF-3
LPPGRFFKGGPPPPRDEHRINDRIRVPRVKVVDENGAMLGEMPTDQARQIARERGYDLVEVAGEARPPVCKLLDYGKYKYEQKKKSHKSKVKQHVQKVKEIRLRPRTDAHDLMTKLKKAREFLEEGDKILITIFFRGREMAHKETGRAMMEKIKAELDDCSKLEHDISMTGPRMQVTLLPKPGYKPKPPAAPKDSNGPAAPAPAPSPAPAPQETPKA